MMTRLHLPEGLALRTAPAGAGEVDR
jgi:hypothetical protein